MDSAFGRVMEARRGYFNARFAEKQSTHPDLDGDVFLRLLRHEVAPVVEAVAQVKADAAVSAGQQLYDLALDLYADGLLTPNGAGVLEKVWREVLPNLASFVAEEPQRVAGSVLNAAYNLSQTPGARPEQWGEILRAVAPLCANAGMLLQAGQVAAWRAGMAHFRLGALQILKTLDGKIARTIFGLDGNATEPDTNALHYALMANPWWEPTDDERPFVPQGKLLTKGEKETAPKKELKIVRRVGAFRGFGGEFLSPPRVVWTREGFVASDGEANYLLMADAFGATLRRVEKVKAETTAMPFKLGKDGAVTFGEVTAKFPELANASSSTANQTTLAVTTELTHGVYLVALV